MSKVERHLFKGVSMMFSLSILRRFIRKHVKLSNRPTNPLPARSLEVFALTDPAAERF